MTFKISKEFSIGIMVMVTIAILFFGFNYLKGINLFNPTNYYYAKYKDIQGLVQSCEVTSHGHKVGLVKEIIYDYDNPDADVLVVLQVDNELKIPKGSRALLQLSLMGTPSIVLDMHATNGMKDLYQKGDTLPTATPAGMLDAITEGVMPKIEQVIPHLDQLLVNLNTVVSDPNIGKSLANINKMSSELAATSTQLKKLVGNDLPPILADAKNITGNFTKVSENLSGVDFKATMGKVDNTMTDLNTTVDKINNGKGSIGLLLNDPRLYNDLDNTVNSADKLLNDLRENPKRYVNITVFGRKEKSEKK
ncbi:MAG: MCE family protein [Paludibacteraceae bacterium]|nr:MCE family protein [Paludibacteraceae bacterium]MBP3717631.1 MCE family protein [Paludibacteraceae bacterium]MBR6106235.1 MCE family protein [Paludibacteraceae bacterium]